LITFEPKKYVETQKERFDTLFVHAPKSIAFKNDITYILKSTHHSISDELNQIQEIDKQFAINLSEHSKTYNQEYKRIKQELDQSLVLLESTLLQEKDNLKRQEIKNNYDGPNQLLEINQLINEKTTHLFKTIDELSIEKIKKIKTIDIKSDKHKDHYKKQITIIENEKDHLLSERLKQYESEITINHKKNHDRMLNLNIKQHEIETEVKIEQKSYDEDIISIKTAFNRVIVRINDNIKLIQRRFNNEIKNFEETTISETQKVEELIEQIKTELLDKNRIILDQFGHELMYFDKKIDELKELSITNNDAITKSYTRDVTQNNQKLAYLKEEITDKKAVLDQQASTKRKQLDSSSPDYKLSLGKINRDLKIARKKLDISLETCIRDTKLSNLRRKKQFHKELLANEYYYTSKLEFYRFKRNTKEMNKNHSLLMLGLRYEQKIHNLKNQRLRLEESLLIMNQVLKEKQTQAIRPLDIQVSLARHIHDTEMNYRMSEHSFDKQTIQFNKQKLLTDDQLLQEEIVYERNLSTLNYQNDVKNIQIEKYLEIEYEKNKYIGDKKINDLQKQLIEYEFQKTEQTLRYHYSLEKESHLNKQKEITFIQRNNAQIIDLNDQIIELNHDYQNEVEKLHFNFQLAAHKSKKIIATALFESQKQRKYLDLFYQLVTKIQSEQDKFYLLINDLYRITDIETFNQAKDYLIEIIGAQLEAKMQLCTSLNSVLTEFYNHKINELTAFKYMSLQKDIEVEYEQSHKQLLLEIKRLDDQIREYRKQSSDLYQEIAFVENQIIDIEKTKGIIRNQITSLRESSDKQSRKTIKNLYLEVQTLNKEIIRHKNEIAHLKLQINQINSRMKTANKAYKPIQIMVNQLEKTRILREENLTKNQYKEGKIYYDSIEFLKSIEIDYERYISHTLTTIKQAFNRFEQFEYKERATKVFVKQLIKSLENQKNKQNNVHTRLTKLIDSQYDHIKKEQDLLIADLTHRFKGERSNATHHYKQKLNKLRHKEIELNDYQRNFIKIQEKHLSNTMKMHKMHFIQKNNHLSYLIKTQEMALYKAKEGKNNLLKATKENSAAVILSNGLSLKQETKKLNQAILSIRKDKNDYLNKLNEEHELQKLRYQTQELHYSTVNKNFRKDLNMKLVDANEAYAKMMNQLNQKYEHLMKYYLRNEFLFDKKIWFKSKKHSIGLSIKTLYKKYQMSYLIYKEKRKLKRQLSKK